jgi:hypothetical protein
MGRIEDDKLIQIKKAIADLIFNNKNDIKFTNGKPSSVHIAQLLKERYGYDITRQAVAKYLEEGIDKYRQSILIEDNEKIRDIKEAIKVQKSLWNDSNVSATDRTKAANAWKGLQKQLIDYEASLNDVELKKAEILRPIYNIIIKPKSVLSKCPKCGHEWYDLEDHDENKDKGKWKPAISKDSEDQKDLDFYENNGGEKIDK